MTNKYLEKIAAKRSIVSTSSAYSLKYPGAKSTETYNREYSHARDKGHSYHESHSLADTAKKISYQNRDARIDKGLALYRKKKVGAALALAGNDLKYRAKALSKPALITGSLIGIATALAHRKKSLEKTASTSQQKKNVAATGVIGIGVTHALKAPGELLGYHNVYHGTSSHNLESIKETGLHPSHGGQTGGLSHAGADGKGSLSEGFKKNSLGKVHVTKHTNIANMFAHHLAKADSTKLKGQAKPTVLKSKVSHRHWEGMTLDRDVGMKKEHAATTTHTVRPEAMNNGKGFKSHSFATKNNMNRYLSQVTGKQRFMTGVARTLGSAGAIAGGVAYLKNHLGDNAK